MPGMKVSNFELEIRVNEYMANTSECVYIWKRRNKKREKKMVSKFDGLV